MGVRYSAPFEARRGAMCMLSSELHAPSPIVFGYEIGRYFSGILRAVTSSAPVEKLFLITDEKVYGLYGREFHDRLSRDWPDCVLQIVPTGEKGKSFSYLERLCEDMMAQGANKHSVVVSLGGGCVGNLAGLAAGLLFRGIRFVEVPTTFTHQTDGCLSNKQAINGLTGKNHFGLYHAPILIWADTRYLSSEPPTLKQAGIAEAVKNALIDQPEFVSYLREHLTPDANYGPQEITDLAHKTMLSKLEILKQDPTEKGYGLVLEYGHTFAHAIEWLSGGEMVHGVAVTIGMKIAAHLAQRVGLIDQQLVDLHYELIDDCLGLTPALPARADVESILEVMRLDNKKIGESIRYVLLEELGACANPEGDYLVSVNETLVADVLRDFLTGYGERRRGEGPVLLRPLRQAQHPKPSLGSADDSSYSDQKLYGS